MGQFPHRDALQEKKALYLYLDEAGDFNFKANGSKYFFMTCVATVRPFNAAAELMGLHYDYVEKGEAGGYFHASEDRQVVRGGVFGVIAAHSDDFVACSYRATKEGLDELFTPRDLYGNAFESLISMMSRGGGFERYSRVIVVADAMPPAAKRGDVKGSLIASLKKYLPEGMPYTFIQQRSEADFNLQIADYLCWALFRREERGDSRAFDLVESVWSAKRTFEQLVDMG